MSIGTNPSPGTADQRPCGCSPERRLWQATIASLAREAGATTYRLACEALDRHNVVQVYP